MSEVFAFKVSVVGKPEWGQIINHHSAGKAKASYWREVNECWDVPYTSLRVAKLGKPRSPSLQFDRNAIYRKRPELKCGSRVHVGTSKGCIVGHDCSANFRVLFDLDSSRYAGLTLSVHPQDIVLAETGKEG